MFAGGGGTAIANKIDDVLCAYSIPLAMAGGTPDRDGGCSCKAYIAPSPRTTCSFQFSLTPHFKLKYRQFVSQAWSASLNRGG